MQITLLDTGYVSTTDVDSQTQETDVNRAGYTGSAVSSITLKVSNLNLGGNVSIENKPIIGTFTEPTSSLISSQSRILGVSAIIQKSINTADWDINDIVQLARMERTEGLKLVYPSINTDTKKGVVEAMGAENTGKLTSNNGFANGSPTDDKGFVSTSTPYLVGRVSNFSISDSPNSDYWKVSFNFVISG